MIRTRYKAFSFLIFSTLFFVSACGGGTELISESLGNSDLNSEIIKVFADQGFQASNISVKTGQTFKIKATGQVTVGLTDASDPNNIKLLFVDADGGPGWYKNSSNIWVQQPSDGLNRNCGFRQGIDTVRNLKNDNTVEVIPSPVESYGPCCSTVDRADRSYGLFDFINKQPTAMAERNRCVVKARYGQLIMKIVPQGENPRDTVPVIVGRQYETTAYKAERDGDLYFAVQDLLLTDDNQGSFDVEISQ